MFQLSKRTWLVDFLFLTITLGVLFFVLLGNRPLFVPDEGRYAEIAREMAASGNFITPYLNGIEYFEKPILFYWLGAFAIKAFGVHLWAVRGINAMLALLGCLYTYFATRRLYGRRAGLFAAFLLATSPLYFVMAHMVSLDLPVTVFLCVCLTSFLLALQESLGWQRRLYLYVSAAAAALAVLTKGLIGILFPALIICVWMLLLNEWRILKRIYLPSCLFIFLCIAAPWHYLVGSAHPEFYYFYFVQQHVLRYITPDVGHYQPIWFFIPWLIVGFFPWVLFLFNAAKSALPHAWRQRHSAKIEICLLLWAVIIFAFFSFSKSKLIPYILPMFPPLAILTGRYFAMLSERPSLKKIMITLIALMYVVLIGLIAIAPKFDSRTILPLAQQIKLQAAADDEIICYNQYYQDLPFYIERRVAIVNWRNELSFGMQHQNTSEWMINTTQFWQRWNSKKRVFAIMSLDEYQRLPTSHAPIYLLGKTATNVLISNRKNSR